jgi:uncharacterized coiled-coil protein SlyX
MKYYKHLLFISISLLGLSTYAQTSKKTLNYQAVILDPKAIDIPGASITGQPLNKGNVCLRFSLLNAQGGLDYEETQQVTTDEYGLVNVAIGAGAQAQSGNSISIYRSFDSVNWNSSVKSLKVSVSYDGCSSFKQVSAQAFNYTPYALYAEAVDYKNVREAPTKLSQFSNDAGYLIPKDLDPLKSDIQTNSSKIEVANKSIADNKQASDATFLVVNQSITSLDTQVATANQTIADNKKSSDAAYLIVNQSITSLDTKVAENASSIITINTKLTDQQNQISDNRNQISATNNTMNAQIGGLQGQINNTNNTVNNLTGVAEMQSNKSTAINLGGANPSDQAYPSQKAAKAYVDQVVSQIATTGVPDATTLAAGKLQLAGDLGGTATSPTVPALANKENSNNKSTNVQTDAASDTKYPSVKAVKAYVDQATMGTALQATVDGKADKASPTFTGTPTAPTPTSTDNSTKLATTAFVQAATAGIALQASVDGKADKISPTFTGTPTAPTPTLGDNSTKLATTAYVDAQVSAGAADASSSAKGIVKLTGDLGGTALAPTVPGLVLKANSSDVATSLGLKEDLSNKSNAALGTSTTLYPTENAVKTYVDASVTSGAPDATTSLKGKIQLAGDLAGTALSPSVVKLRGTPISSVVPTTAGHVLTYDVNGSATWAAPANSANTISGVVPVANGGTGLSSVTSGGAVYASSSSALTTGTLPITAGGTGATTANLALNALVPDQTSNTGKYLTTNGTNTSWSAVTATSYSGTLPVLNGGTGQTTIAGVQSILGLAGTKVAIGSTAGATTQGGSAIAIGSEAGKTSQGQYAVAVGGAAGNSTQGIGAIAIGYAAGQTSQGTNSVAIGSNAAQSGQGTESVAIGYAANSTGNSAIGIGTYSSAAGNNSIAIGYKAATTAANTIQLGGDGVVTGSTAITNVKTTGTLTAGTVTYPNAHNLTAGQVLTINATGSASWSSPVSSGGSNHTIGESYGGGIVFYIWDGGAHGLIAATADLGYKKWGTDGTLIYSIRDGIGAGKYNTERIIQNIKSSDIGYTSDYTQYAAYVCATYKGGNFADWYLPSKYELNLLYLQQTVVGGFSGYYWTSSEYASRDVTNQNFTDGNNSGGMTKSLLQNVRPIRSF